MEWGKQQGEAISAAVRWLNDPAGQQVFRLFGYAGTGKTTLAREIADAVNGKVLYACFTGKAALVLRQKGCAEASTIHSLIYRPEEDVITGETRFVLNLDSVLAGAELLIVDEVSMVGEELARDLLSFGTRVLVLGDPAQLPPVKGEGFFINARPDAMLTEVHRQAEDNPIIRMSMDVREGRGLTPGDYGDSRVVRRADIGKDEMREIVLSADQLLCGMNKTRHAFNARCREILGKGDDWKPVAGDKLICLRNNHDKGLLNGAMWTADRVRYTGDGVFTIRTTSLDDEGATPLDTTVPLQFFRGDEKDLDFRFRRRHDEFAYGYAITVHKSQGSQWDSVLVFDESRAFREDAAKHLYTAITRAAERITVVV